MCESTHSLSGQPDATIDAAVELLNKIPSSIVHLIDNQQSIELAFGDLEIILLRHNHVVVAVLARIGDQLQWPLTKDEATLKLNDSHYLFTLSSNEGILNYGLTIPSEGQEHLLNEFDSILEKYIRFKEERVEGKVERKAEWVVAREVIAKEVEDDVARREKMEESAAAYWTTLAPNVEEYSGYVARMIAAGSGILVKVVLLCGDVTVERLKWGNEFMGNRLGKRENAHVSLECLNRIRRVKSMTKRSEDVVIAILLGVIKVSETMTTSVVNSRLGNTFFNMFPGEIILASFDEKICDAVEVAAKNIMSTSSLVTTEVVSLRYGEEVAKATNEGLDAAGHALRTTWAVFKLRKAVNPKGALKLTTLARAAASKVKKAS